MYALVCTGSGPKMSTNNGVFNDLKEFLPPALGASWWEEAKSLGPHEGSIDAFLPLNDAHGRDEEGRVLGHQPCPMGHDVPQVLGQGLVQFWEAPEVGLYTGQVGGGKQVAVMQLG